MKLTFEPVTNRIGDNYFIVPKGDAQGVKCVMRCNEAGAFIVNLLTENHNREQMIAAVSERYPAATEEEVTAAVDGVRAALRGAISRSDTGKNEGGAKEE